VRTLNVVAEATTHKTLCPPDGGRYKSNNKFSIERRLSHLRCWVFSHCTHPVLTPWAKLWRAYGARVVTEDTATIVGTIPQI
jgi:hypothetical protein